MRLIVLRLLVVVMLAVVITGGSVLAFISTYLQPSRDRAFIEAVSGALAGGYRFRDATPLPESAEPDLGLFQVHIKGEGVGRHMVFRVRAGKYALSLVGVRHVPDLWVRFPSLPLPDLSRVVEPMTLERRPRSQLPTALQSRLAGAAENVVIGVENLSGWGAAAIVIDPRDHDSVWVVGERAGRSRLLRWLVFLGALVLLAAGAYLVVRPLLLDLRALLAASRRFGTGDLDARADIRSTGPAADVGHAFDLMAERLSRQARTRETLLRAVAHEIRNPLARIVFAEASLRRSVLNEAQREQMEIIRRGAGQIERFVSEVLELVRLNVNLRDRAPRLTTSEVCEIVRTEIGDADAIQLHWDEREATAAVSGFVVQRAVKNLISNALRYGGDEVHVSLGAIDRGLELIVEDNGVGLEPEARASVFEPFVRLGDALDHEGLGLGLTLVRELVTQSGGTVEATAPVRFTRGARFVVTLPWADDADA